MKTWRICAHGAFEAAAQEAPDSLAEPLRACLERPPRRINRYIRLALIGAQRCVARLDRPLPATTPLYLASEQGSAAEAVRLMDEIVLRGRSPMPMSFINVSSNMVGYYLAASLGLSGRNMNVARSQGAFGAMLELASLEAEPDSLPEPLMLLGAVAECVWPLAEHRKRCELPDATPLVEASYWLAVDDKLDDSVARLAYARTRDEIEAQAWLAAGERWAIDPHLSGDQQQVLGADLERCREWRAPFCHRGHPDAVVHALIAALGADPVPRLHVVAGDPFRGYQLMGVW
ncbi:MAG: hypothetical protein L0H73_01250 [Nitrococcus sp.]|nr:hypothetical protein [Nitrococcus sp.]